MIEVLRNPKTSKKILPKQHQRLGNGYTPSVCLRYFTGVDSRPARPVVIMMTPAKSPRMSASIVIEENSQLAGSIAADAIVPGNDPLVKYMYKCMGDPPDASAQ